MKRNIFGLIASVVYIGIILVSSKFFAKSNKEASRKYIHIMLSNWWIIAMIFFDTPIFACICPGLFIIINFISYKYNLIKTMERDEGEQDGLGTVYYAISLFVLAYFTFGPLKNTVLGLCAIIVMGYADGMAAIMGKAIKSPEFKIGNTTKTLAGCITMFIITFIIVSGFLVFNSVAFWYLKAILISAIITIVEAVSIKGTDNLTVPLVTAGLLFLM